MAVWQGVGVSKGIAIGPAFLYQPDPLDVPARKAASSLVELDRLQAAVKQALEEVRALRAAAPPILQREADRILGAQGLLMEDPALVDRARGAILEGQPADQAWVEAVDAYLAIFSPMRDQDLWARAADLRDVGRRVLAAMVGESSSLPFASVRGRIVVADMLSPTEALQLAAQSVLGVCLVGGTPTASIAVIAHRVGLPTVVDLGAAILEQAQTGMTVVVDGGTGVVEVDPVEETLVTYRDRQRLLEADQPSYDVTEPARTADGWRVDVRVDLAHPAALVSALAHGAEGPGLIRTDFAFLGRPSPPSEEEQVAAYQGLLQELPPGPVAFSSLSAGQEEDLPFPAEPNMANPMLGLKGIRLSLAYLSSFREQLRAILRAAVGRPTTITFPMVETLSELRAAREWLRRAQKDLKNAAVPHAQEVQVALLLQTPLAVLNLEALVDEADVFYLDLDLLTAYLLACDRQNLRVTHLFRPLHPVVLGLVRDAVGTVHRRGKRLEICGDAAGFPTTAPLLLGLGVDGFCLPVDRIAGTKLLLRRLAVPEVRDLANRALRTSSAPEVESLVEEFLAQRIPDPLIPERGSRS